MADIIANDLERFRHDLDQADQMITGGEKGFGQMMTELESLSAVWTGTAHDAYLAQFRTDSALMEEMIRHLREYVKELETAHAAYTQCERQIAQSIASIHI